MDEFSSHIMDDGDPAGAKARLEGLLLDGLSNGEAEEMTPDDWAAIRAEAMLQFQARKGEKTD
jgi:hypothetical protein